MSGESQEKQNQMKFLFKPLFFIFALLTVTYIVLYVEKLKPSDLKPFGDLFVKDDVILKSQRYPIKSASGYLTREEFIYANIAWKYFENNYDQKTGFVNGKDTSSIFTIKDLTSYLMGMFCALEIGIVDSTEVDSRMNKLFISLDKIPLYENKLPNKKYNTGSLKMLDENGNTSENGFGWSALDIGRFFNFVNKVNLQYPQYQPKIRKIIKRWKMHEMIENGNLKGMVFQSNKRKYKLIQEGRLGYEEYCGKALYKSGFDVTEAISYRDFIKFIDIYGYRIAADTREVRKKNSHNYVLSDPYYLDGLENGWDINSRELAFRVFMVQKARYIDTGILTATGEDYTDNTANYVYNSIYADFRTWTCYDEMGKKRNDLKMLSTKTSFAWYVLYEDEYANLLFNNVKDLYDPQRGWYSGRYEVSGKINKSISASTNAIVLEALNYKMNGTIIQF
ncbi:MAG: DUF3131 domain-containing protein [Bacteroidetes bacterium]|nr:DUF3131 domain-containing protein [Bacteroidota bacterium]HET6244333.1 DUF3131 domain-containing protein [Bacteroidia bacterium]